MSLNNLTQFVERLRRTVVKSNGPRSEKNLLFTTIENLGKSLYPHEP